MKGLSLERINNNGNYCKENCRWATATEQNRNKRSNRFLTYNGETRLLIDWAKIYNLSWDTLDARLKRLGWSVEKALTTPLKHSPIACELFAKINKEMGWNGQYTFNGGEFRVLRYHVDYYEPNLNIVIEYDEKFHKSTDQKEIDELRQRKIVKTLNCRFFRIKEGEEYLWREIIKF